MRPLAALLALASLLACSAQMSMNRVDPHGNPLEPDDEPPMPPLPAHLTHPDIMDWDDTQMELTINQMPGIVLVLWWSFENADVPAALEALAAATPELLKNGITVARVNADKNMKMAQRYGIPFLPSLRVFREGAHQPFLGRSDTAQDLVDYMLKIDAPIPEFSDMESLSKHVDTLVNFDFKCTLHPEPVVVGCFATKEEAVDINAAALAKNSLGGAFGRVVQSHGYKHRFAVVTDPHLQKELACNRDPKGQVIILMPSQYQHKHETMRKDFTGDHAAVPLTEWVEEATKPLVGVFNLDSAARYLGRMKENEKAILHLYVPDLDFERNSKGASYWANRLRRVAKEVPNATDHIEFTVIKPSFYDIKTFDLKDADNRTWVVIDGRDSQGQGNKWRMEEEFNMDDTKEFVKLWMTGRLRPWLKSKELNETQQEALGFVTEVTGQTFGSIVNEASKDVLLLVYSDVHTPQTSKAGCDFIAPIWRELAAKLKGVPTIEVVQIDAEMNDIPKGVLKPDLGWPQIHLIKAVDPAVLEAYNAQGEEKGDPPIKSRKFYEGEGKVQDIAYWAQKEATHYFKVPGAKKLAGKKKTEL